MSSPWEFGVGYLVNRARDDGCGLDDHFGVVVMDGDGGGDYSGFVAIPIGRSGEGVGPLLTVGTVRVAAPTTLAVRAGGRLDIAGTPLTAASELSRHGGCGAAAAALDTGRTA